jgi:RimJ/RimL family protein N-acetyltransferase
MPARSAAIETPRLRLREVASADLPALAAMFADREVMAHYLDFLTPAAAANWVATHMQIRAATGYAPWTVELRDGTFVGQCGPLPQLIDGKREVEVVCFLRRRYWRGGFADEACLASVRYAFERIRVDRVIALILPANRPSVRLALRCGLTFERNLVHGGLACALYAVERSVFFGRVAGSGGISASKPAATSGASPGSGGRRQSSEGACIERLWAGMLEH